MSEKSYEKKTGGIVHYYSDDAVFYNDDALLSATDPVDKSKYLGKADVPGATR